MSKQSKDLSPYAGCNHIMTFGKHKGKLLGWIVEHDPQYIVWMSNNSVMKIEPTIVMQCQDEVDEMWDDLQDRAGVYSAEDWGCRD